MTSEPINQYTEICGDAIKSSSAKLGKTFESLLLEILLLYMTIQRKINFTQMERYGTYCEQTYRTDFNRGRAKCIDWVKFNLALCRRYESISKSIKLFYIYRIFNIILCHKSNHFTAGHFGICTFCNQFISG